LSKPGYGIIRNLVVEEGLVDNSQIEQIIEQVTKERFNLGKAKAEFAQTLDELEEKELLVDPKIVEGLMKARENHLE